jgi:hypothetical protein
MENGFGRLRAFAEHPLVRKPTEAIASVTGDWVLGARTVEIRKGPPCLFARRDGGFQRERRDFILNRGLKLEPGSRSRAPRGQQFSPNDAENNRRREFSSQRGCDMLRRASLIRGSGRAGGCRRLTQIAMPSRLRSGAQCSSWLKNCRARSCFGASKNASGSPTSTTSPLSMNRTVSATLRAKPIS